MKDCVICRYPTDHYVILENEDAKFMVCMCKPCMNRILEKRQKMLQNR